MKDGETITTKDGGKQSFVSARVDLIPPECLLLLGECLRFGANKYGEDNWKKIPLQDHLNHVMVHVLKFQAGDRTEPHLVNVLARGVFALWRAIEQGEQGTTYIHPDMTNDGNEEEKEGFTSGEEIMRRDAKPLSIEERFFQPAPQTSVTTIIEKIPHFDKDGKKEGTTFVMSDGAEIYRPIGASPTPHEEEYAGPRIEKGRLDRT